MNDPSWIEWVNLQSKRIAEEAQPQLMEIAEQAHNRHHGSEVTLSQTDTMRLAMILSQVQQESFTLGVRLGMKMLIECMEHQGQTQ